MREEHTLTIQQWEISQWAPSFVPAFLRCNLSPCFGKSQCDEQILYFSFPLCPILTLCQKTWIYSTYLSNQMSSMNVLCLWNCHNPHCCSSPAFANESVVSVCLHAKRVWLLRNKHPLPCWTFLRDSRQSKHNFRLVAHDYWMHDFYHCTLFAIFVELLVWTSCRRLVTKMQQSDYCIYLFIDELIIEGHTFKHNPVFLRTVQVSVW